MMKAGGMAIGTSRGPSRALAQGLTPDSGPLHALHFWYHQKQLAEYIKNLADETVETGVWDKFKRHVKMRERDGGDTNTTNSTPEDNVGTQLE